MSFLGFNVTRRSPTVSEGYLTDVSIGFGDAVATNAG
jgi:hypothetical protein